MDQKRTKWRLDGHAWLISKIEKVGDLDEMLEMMPKKFERKRTWGKYLTRKDKHYVQNEWDFWTISILMGQNVNENKAMTKVVIATKQREIHYRICRRKGRSIFGRENIK